MSECDEQVVVADIRARLIRDFPDATHIAVDAAIGHACHRFENSRVRIYIPLLVEKRARTVLSERASSNDR